MELRCDGPTKHGVLDYGQVASDLLEGVTLQTNCKRKRCGAERGVVVLHTFDLFTGDYTTRRFKIPEMKEKQNGARHLAAVRPEGREAHPSRR